MTSIGPCDPARSVSADSLMRRAEVAAAEAGVTRLAELTRLDRLGLPVWQAVRPMSRALSVHQGKGVTETEARIGALLEAVESHHAEGFEAEGPVCRFDALPDKERAPMLADFARDRASPPGEDDAYRWAEAADLANGGSIYLPFDLVSLDLTRAVPSLLDRSSNGVAAGASRAQAATAALNEIIERDAVREWKIRGLFACTADALRIDDVPFDWLGEWRERIERAGIWLRFYRVASITGTPVFICELNDSGKDGAPYRATYGSGCHAVPEIALFRALAEAIQSRATFISGAREDLLPSDYADSALGAAVAFGLPLPASIRGMAWDEVRPGPAGLDGLIEALARAGYGQVALVTLGEPQGLFVARAFVPGLGGPHRRRRRP